MHRIIHNNTYSFVSAGDIEASIQVITDNCESQNEYVYRVLKLANLNYRIAPTVLQELYPAIPFLKEYENQNNNPYTGYDGTIPNFGSIGPDIEANVKEEFLISSARLDYGFLHTRTNADKAANIIQSTVNCISYLDVDYSGYQVYWPKSTTVYGYAFLLLFFKTPDSAIEMEIVRYERDVVISWRVEYIHLEPYSTLRPLKSIEALDAAHIASLVEEAWTIEGVEAAKAAGIPFRDK